MKKRRRKRARRILKFAARIFLGLISKRVPRKVSKGVIKLVSERLEKECEGIPRDDVTNEHLDRVIRGIIDEAGIGLKITFKV